MSSFSSSTNSERSTAADPPAMEHEEDQPALSGAGPFPPDQEQEPCPTPLEWHEVLKSFLQEAEHWYLDVNGDRLLGRTWGEGPPLYFLNGLAGTHELYSLLVYLLRDEFRCVVFDYPDSSHATNDSLAELLPRVVALHGDDRPVSVYARDFGNQIARWTAEKHSGLIGSLIAQTPTLGLRLQGTERWLASLARHLPIRTRRIPGRFAIQQRTHRIWFPPFDQTRFDFYRESTGRQSMAGVAQRFLLSDEAVPEWTDQAAPDRLLIIRAEGESPAQTAAAERLAERFPAAQTEWLHSSGQLACLTHPHRVARLVREFLRPDDSGVS